MVNTRWQQSHYSQFDGLVQDCSNSSALAMSNRCTSLSFHINQTNHSCDMAKIVFDLEKTHHKFLKKICQNLSFQQNFSKILSGNNHD